MNSSEYESRHRELLDAEPEYRLLAQRGMTSSSWESYIAWRRLRAGMLAVLLPPVARFYAWLNARISTTKTKEKP